MRRLAAAAALAVLVAGVSCAPRLRSLPGAVAPAIFPRSELPRGHQRALFQWTLEDPDITARGEGAARSAWPDSVRLDFFVAGGMGGGAAVMIGTELRLPPTAQGLARRLIPPAPLLWAALGRLVVPALPDTAARVDGDTLRADIGVPVAWRVTFVRDTLRRLERVDGGRVLEWVERGSRVRYRNEVNRRQLDLTVTRVDPTGAHDPIIWVFE
jgi:hypothetical protein